VRCLSERLPKSIQPAGLIKSEKPRHVAGMGVSSGAWEVQAGCFLAYGSRRFPRLLQTGIARCRERHYGSSTRSFGPWSYKKAGLRLLAIPCLTPLKLPWRKESIAALP
jgi:hypothetical protein